MNASGGRVIAPRLVLGGGLMVLGTLFLLDELRIVDFDDVFDWWPLLPIAVGLAMALRPAGSGSRAAGVLIALIGGWLLLNELDFIDIDPFDAWPVILIGLGGWVVWRSLSESTEAPFDVGAPQRSPGAIDTSPADNLSAFALLGYTAKASTSRSFQAADATAIMGGCTVDLRGAGVDAEGAVVDAFAFWGGIKILVPQDWVVTNRVLPLLGGVDDKSRATPGATGQLLVRGTAIMGGVEIANRDEED